jgi:hypothetical protein
MKHWFVSLSILLFIPLQGMDLGAAYDPDTHNIYSSGYPAAPVRNTSTNFIGVDRVPVTVGWSSTALTKNFGFLSPRHYLVARHFGGATSVRVFGADGQRQTLPQESLRNTDLGLVFAEKTYGDLTLGTLTDSISTPAFPKRVGILDLYPTSASENASAYIGQPIHVVGRAPDSIGSTRLAQTTIQDIEISGNSHVFTYARDIVKLQSGDSGGPTYAAWRNPNGIPEHALIGNHAAIADDDSVNFDNFAAAPAVMSSLNSFMHVEGRSLRIVGEPSLNWFGISNNTISNTRSWGLRGPQTTQDVYASFSGNDAGSSGQVVVDALFNLRGLYFLSTGSAGHGLTFSGTEILEIGRGGVTNYDQSPQVFQAPLRLTAPQVWDVGTGGVSVTNLDTNGHHLEIIGSGPVSFSGNISGSGSVAFDQGTVLISSPAFFTGATWIHDADVDVLADLSSSSVLHLSQNGTLTGNGTVSEIRGNGILSPGPDNAILTASQLTDTDGIGLQFSVTSSASSYSLPAANDLLRLTHTTTPLTAALNASSSLQFFIHTGSQPVVGDSFLTGLFTEAASDPVSQLSAATLQVYIQDPSGLVTHEGETYSLYSGTDNWALDTIPQTVDFGSGPVSGFITRLRLLPPAGTYEHWTYLAIPESVPEQDKDPEDILNPAGIQNLLAYAHGLDPLNPDLTKLPYVQSTSATLELFYRERTNAQDIDYLFETVNNLSGVWGEESLIPTLVDPDPDNNGEIQLMKITRPIATAENLLFLRSNPQPLP